MVRIVRSFHGGASALAFGILLAAGASANPHNHDFWPGPVSHISVPEINVHGAAAALALVLGSVVVIAGRRVRRSK